MIGLRQLDLTRTELYASAFPLETLKPYLLEAYADAYATIVLYEDNIEVFHETGIFSFDASEPETFNYEEFQAPLVAEYNDRVAVCTVANLFSHFERYMEDRPMEDDPFHNLVFSISHTPPDPQILLDWERHLDLRLKNVLYDDHTPGHFKLFPDEVLVIYSHDNYYTSVTSDNSDLVRTVFEDVAERHLYPLSRKGLSQSLVQDLYSHTQTYGQIRLKAERLYHQGNGDPFLLVTYPNQSLGPEKLISRIALTVDGQPIGITPAEMMPRLTYHLRYSDLSFLPMVLVVLLLVAAVIAACYLHVLTPSASFASYSV